MIAIGLKFTNKIDVETPILGYLALKNGEVRGAQGQSLVHPTEPLLMYCMAGGGGQARPHDQRIPDLEDGGRIDHDGN